MVSDIIHRWKLAPTLLGAHGVKRFSVGRGWQGWVFEGTGVVSGKVVGTVDAEMKDAKADEEVERGVKARLKLVMREK